eukprot:6261148-Prorocentrum_lima.AAC.1
MRDVPVVGELPEGLSADDGCKSLFRDSCASERALDDKLALSELQLQVPPGTGAAALRVSSASDVKVRRRGWGGAHVREETARKSVGADGTFNLPAVEPSPGRRLQQEVDTQSLVQPRTNAGLQNSGGL